MPEPRNCCVSLSVIHEMLTILPILGSISALNESSSILKDRLPKKHFVDVHDATWRAAQIIIRLRLRLMDSGAAQGHVVRMLEQTWALKLLLHDDEGAGIFTWAAILVSLFLITMVSSSSSLASFLAAAGASFSSSDSSSLDSFFFSFFSFLAFFSFFSFCCRHERDRELSDEWRV
jgi:hypothetical protein